jgi:lipoprotein-releasing system permease protein
MNLSLFIARRYLVSKKSHNAINIISGVALGGIAVGTMALIIVLSAFNGISDLVKSLYNSFGAEIRITAVKGKTFQPIGAKFDSIRHLKEIKYVNNVLQDKALLIYNDRQTNAILKGVSPTFEPMMQFDTLVHNGSFFLRKGGLDYGVFGTGIARRLGVGESNTDYLSVACYAPKRGLESTPNPTDAIIEKHLFPAGTFSINDDFDYNYIIVSIDFARQIFDYKDSSVTSIEISPAKGANIDDVKSKIKSILGSEYNVKDRFEQNELIFKTLKSEKLWTFIILVFILIIATFNIVGSLSMLILEKEKDIDILWKMGADIYSVRKIFLYEGMLITFIGASIGIILGTAICLIQIYFKLVPIGPGFIIDAYPVKLQIMDYVYIFGSVIVIGLLSSWYPVRAFTSQRLGKAS